MTDERKTSLILSDVLSGRSLSGFLMCMKIMKPSMKKVRNMVMINIDMQNILVRENKKEKIGCTKTLKK